MRVVGSAIGLLGLGLVAGACASTGSGSPRFESAPRMSRQAVAAQIVATRDSIFAQAIADVEGPGVSISAQYSNLTGSRRVRATLLP